MIRVLICDDQDVVRIGLHAILSSAPGIEVVGQARDGSEAVERIPFDKPDVVLMDLKMPGMNGIQATRIICERFPSVYVLVLTTYDAEEWVLDAVRAGAAGYLLKDTPRDQLISAVRGTAEGKTHIDPSVAGKIVSQVSRTTARTRSPLLEELSVRELEVLRLIARGLSNAEISARLYLSEGTVRNYVSAILSKLGLSDRTQAAVLALQHGLNDGFEGL
jgi:DNA-binding NarL/FixJ family response regulator